MLVELVVENYAVIERLRVRFHAGLNLLTGETGSGKSIVVDCLGLLFGGRASADMVRAGCARARVSGIFELPESKAARQALDAAGIAVEDDELLLEREILSNGKSRAFAASRPAAVALLRGLAPYLGDIHGQHDQQRLFSADAQLDMVDEFGGASALLDEVADTYRKWRACSAELEELARSEQERLRLADLWAHQRQEIEAAAPKAGEDDALENERRVLQNMSRLQENANAAYAGLYDSAGSALAQVRQARRRIDDLRRIDAKLDTLSDVLQPAEVAIEEAAFTLRDYLGRLEADPGRLDEIESRLAVLDRLKRKYGPALVDVSAFLEDVRGKLDSAGSTEDRRNRIRAQQTGLAGKYEAAARSLTTRRREAAVKLQSLVEKELASLAMERTRFQIGVGAAGWSERGSDAIQFLVAPNVGEELKPLEKVASGGELSRIALALKTSISVAVRERRGPARTLVFDEVDAGIGGRAAETVGRRLKQLAAWSQVLCVTHLPQIAGFADHHYAVEKRELNGRTVAVLEELDGAARAREIGRMLSGEQLTPEALKHAEQLIRLGAEA